MPTDARQIAEMEATIEKQRDRAMELLDEKQKHIEGWKQRLKETNDQWIKETNEHRAELERLRESLYTLEEQVVARTRERDEVRAILSTVCNVSNKEREAHEKVKQERDELGYLLAVLTGKDGPRRLEHTGSYTCEPGRNIYRDGKPFIRIVIPDMFDEEDQTTRRAISPADADNAARAITALLNKDEEQRWAAETAKLAMEEAR